MALGITPISIEKILNDGIIENSRVEYKEGWNPERILRTICAFANDIENVGGGYIVIGVKEVDGVPVAFPGLSPADIVTIDRELTELCNHLRPRYFPHLSQETFKGVTLCILWVPPGENRPYSCPIVIGKDVKDRGRAYFIRRLSNTVQANHDEEVDLIQRSSKASFDNMTNDVASFGDISRLAVVEYVSKMNSRLDIVERDPLRIYQDLRIVRGPPENIRPVNVGLMMFCQTPEKFFPKTYSQVTIKGPDYSEQMETRTFTGTVWDQIAQTMRFLQSEVIIGRINKRPGQLETENYYNYSYDVLKEAVVNAYFHRDYQIEEPVKIDVFTDRIEIQNFPGPDYSITDEAMARNDFSCGYYRNSRLGDFLKELDLAEARNSGIPRMIKDTRANGSPDITFHTDQGRRLFLVKIPIHPDFINGSEDKGSEFKQPEVSEKTIRTADEIKDQIIEQLRLNGCMSSSEISRRLGYSRITATFRRCLGELLDAGLVDYLYPDNPHTKHQKICLRTGRRK